MSTMSDSCQASGTEDKKILTNCTTCSTAFTIILYATVVDEQVVRFLVEFLTKEKSYWSNKVTFKKSIEFLHIS